ncbi:alpha/beta fold hydrolase [Amycolatopsis sp. FDAARGOS 1241]|uniref:alpha/beta fold hydrolase n=1 Tax=Amycolatopsis sp. FDAARGOS 1241 TaxID=2778070 RepID=UPI00194DD451|nr:alpha/beta fold hydrolase [Amycolatopsis sp. FDAARGOS 1241]
MSARKREAPDTTARGLPEALQVPGVRHRYIDTGRLRTHVAETGAGSPVLLLHGWAKHWYMWRHVMPLLSDSHRLIAADLRGAGWSDAPRQGYRTAELVDDLRALLDSLGLGRIALVGHDRGAALAFQLAFDDPDRVTRVVALTNSTPTSMSDGWPATPGAMGGHRSSRHLWSAASSWRTSRSSPGPGCVAVSPTGRRCRPTPSPRTWMCCANPISHAPVNSSCTSSHTKSSSRCCGTRRPAGFARPRSCSPAEPTRSRHRQCWVTPRSMPQTCASKWSTTQDTTSPKSVPNSSPTNSGSPESDVPTELTKTSSGSGANPATTDDWGLLRTPAGGTAAASTPR